MLRREDGYVLRRTLEFEVEGERMKMKLRMTLKKHVGLSSEDTFW